MQDIIRNISQYCDKATCNNLLSLCWYVYRTKLWMKGIYYYENISHVINNCQYEYIVVQGINDYLNIMDSVNRSSKIVLVLFDRLEKIPVLEVFLIVYKFDIGNMNCKMPKTYAHVSKNNKLVYKLHTTRAVYETNNDIKTMIDKISGKTQYESIIMSSDSMCPSTTLITHTGRSPIQQRLSRPRYENVKRLTIHRFIQNFIESVSPIQLTIHDTITTTDVNKLISMNIFKQKEVVNTQGNTSVFSGIKHIRICSDNLRDIVKIIKHIRDHKDNNNSNKITRSFIGTTIEIVYMKNVKATIRDNYMRIYKNSKAESDSQYMRLVNHILKNIQGIDYMKVISGMPASKFFDIRSGEITSNNVLDMTSNVCDFTCYENLKTLTITHGSNDILDALLLPQSLKVLKLICGGNTFDIPESIKSLPCRVFSYVTDASTLENKLVYTNMVAHKLCNNVAQTQLWGTAISE